MKRLVSVLVLSTISSFALAQNFNQTYIDLAFTDTELDAGPFDVDGDGFSILGSYAFSDNMFVLGGYSEEEFDFGVDGETLSVGLGFATDLSDKLDFVADLSYLDSEASSVVGTVSENGYGIRAGVRGRVMQSLELEGGLTLVDLADSDTGFRAVARYYFSDSFAVSGTLLDGDGTTLAVGVRAEFGEK